ncbi:hypothetical protein [Algibacter sp. 2305UL17-15]|uniref:hypothetical protein n=1 Tax=Algibacter sp. 2305UL17-15 TaxID=3231268 RepID=UPI003457D85B
MQINNYLKSKMQFVAILGLLFGLASCGSYQYVGVDSDGIYGGTNENTQNRETVVVTKDGNANSSDYYQNYFKNKAQEYEIATDNGAIFTDIDSYSSEQNYAVNDTIYNDYQGQAGWGQANSHVTINYIDNGWNNWGWGWNDPWLYGGFGWGWNNWGWNRWNRWGWNAGFGWGGWNGWGWNAWCPPGFYANNFYAGVNNRFYNRGVAFNNSRRGSSSLYGRGSNTALRRSSSADRTRTSASRYSTSRRSSVSSNNPSSSRYSTSRRSSVTNGRSTTARRSSSPTVINRNSTVRRSSSRQPSYSTSRSSSSTRSSTPIRRSSSATTSRSRSSSSNNNSSYSRRSSSSSNSSYSRSSSGSSRSSSGGSSRSSSSGGRRR